MKLLIKLEGLDCAHCAGLIEEEVRKLENVNLATLNFVMQKLTCDVNEYSPEEFVEIVGKIARRHEPKVKVRRI